MRAVFGVKSCNWGGCEGVLVNYASEPPLPILLLFHATIIIQTITLIFSQIANRPPIGHLLFTFPLLLKYKTDFPVIINLPQRFTATISAKVRRHVFSAVSHNIRIADASGHVRSFASAEVQGTGTRNAVFRYEGKILLTLFGDHIFPYGDLKKIFSRQLAPA